MVNIRKVVSIAAFPAVIALLVSLPFLLPFDEIGTLWSIEKTRAWIEDFSPWSPLVFIAIQIFQVVIFIIPGEVTQVAGGLLFSAFRGTIYSLIGIGIGSTVNYFVGKLLGKRFAIGVVGKKRFESMQSILTWEKARLTVFLIFALPGIPKDSLTYVGGAFGMPLKAFIGYSMLGRTFGIIGSAIIGQSLANQRWHAASILLGAALLITACGIWQRDNILKWLHKVSKRERKNAPPSPTAHKPDQK